MPTLAGGDGQECTLIKHIMGDACQSAKEMTIHAEETVAQAGC